MMENIVLYISPHIYLLDMLLLLLLLFVMLKHDQSDLRCGSEAGFVAMGVKARMRKASLWNEQDIIHYIHTGLEIYRNSITLANVSDVGTDLLLHGSCWPGSRRDRAGFDRP